jgi:hypothetical protein
MKEISFFTNEYIFIANMLLLFSYLQTNMLILRLVFVAAYIFFTIFFLTLPSIAIDNVFFSVLFCFLNIYLSIPLISLLVPPDFNQEQREIYTNHFKDYITPRELYELYQVGKRKVYKVNSCLFKAGHEFSSLFFVSKIGKNCKIELRTGKKKLLNIKEYSWIGIPEYLQLLSTKSSIEKALEDNETGEWKIQANLYVGIAGRRDSAGAFSLTYSFDDNINIVNQADENPEKDTDRSMGETTLLVDDTIIIYEFELKDIEKVANKLGYSIMRGLHSIWLKYCSTIIKLVDRGILEHKEKMEKKKSDSIQALRKAFTQTHFKVEEHNEEFIFNK